MPRPFSSTDVKLLISEHNRIMKRLSAITDYPDRYRAEVKKASEALVDQAVWTILKDISIDEINRDKKGIRLKALRYYGYKSIADIWAAPVYKIASVRGISEDTAYTIKSIVEDIVSKVRQGVKIKLSTDDKTTAATYLVASIYKYDRIIPISESCQKILDNYSYKIKSAITDILPSTSWLKWLFTSAVKKQKAIEAYNYLRQLLSSEYSKSTKELFFAIEEINETSDSVAWEDFSTNSIRYFNILEDINPGILGTDDSVYGLPEDLAREIQDECFFPDGLLCKLRRYQEWGVKYILHQEQVLLGDEMGLGKTIQAIATMVSLRNTGATHFMVVCPASIITNWCREISKMSKLSVTKIHGTGRSAALRSWISSGGVAVTTYETTGYIKLDDDFKFTLLVVDEAHYIKNPDAKRTQNVKKLKNHASRALFMTGTALENKVEEMIALIEMLQPKIAVKVQRMVALSAAPQFREAVAPVYYRRKREDVLTELPDLIENKEWCTLLPEEEQIYEKAVLSKNYVEARRVSWNVNDLRKSSKARRLLEIIEEAEAEERKVIVFSFFLDTIRKIKLLLGNKCLNPINGSVPPQRRQEIIDEFEKAPAGSVLVAQIQTGGTGLNIQTASVVVICEPQFKPSTENQAISRAYRMGQTRNVLVYRLLCVNTVDERITSILESKQEIFDAFADESVAASRSIELDDTTFGDIIEEEIIRINAKYGNSNTEEKIETGGVALPNSII